LKNLLLRSLTGILYAGAVLVAIHYGLVSFLFLFGIFTLLGSYEMIRMLQQQSFSIKTGMPAIALAISVFLIISLILANHLPFETLFFSIVAFGLIFILQLYSGNSAPAFRIAENILPTLYIAIPFSTAIFLLEKPNEIEGIFIYLFFITLWINDSMAYVTGMLFGKHRLFERISPKKSWEGFFGGLVFSVATGLTVGILTESDNLFIWAGYSLVVSIFATFGDLVESMFKRSFNIKDSGNILPGHGGILDRLDGATLGLPAAAAYLYFFF